MKSQLEKQILLASPGMAAQRAYWADKIVNDFGTILLDPLSQSEGTLVLKECNITIDAELSAAIFRIGNRSQIAISMILLSAVKVLLWKYKGRKVEAVVTPVKAPLHPHGLNDHVVIVDSIDDSMIFKDFLINVSRSAIDGYNNQDFPIDEIVKDLRGTYSKMRVSAISLRVDGFHERLDFQPAEIAFCFSIENDILHGAIKFDAGAYDEELIERLAGYYTAMLRGLTSNVSLKIADIPFEGCFETERFVRGSHREISRGCYPKLFSAQAKLSCERVAVRFGSVAMTYAELERRSNSYCRRLSSFSEDGKGLIAAVVMERSADLIAAIIGIWKWGAAYLPVDPAFPKERREKLIQHAQAAVILTTNDLFDALTDSCKQPVIDVSEITEADATPVRLYENDDSSELAYIIYTSGSTGEPKGVMIEHHGMMNHLYAKIEDFRLDDASRVAQNASQCFDISIWQMFAPLISGGEVVVFDNVIVKDVDRFLQAAEAAAVSVLEIVPSFLAVMMDALDLVPRQFAHLRYLVSTGEKLPVWLANRWLVAFPEIKMANVYGPTEASDDITHFIFDNATEIGTSSVLIGKPIANTNVYVVNDNGQLCPAGVSGELFVSGKGVGRGYIHDAVRSELSFGYDFITGEKKARMYRTGDFCRFRKDGLIEFLGRRDYQVKVNGYRIELGEIEKCIVEIEGIREAVVRDLKSDAGQSYLCAYYVCAPEILVDKGTLRNELASQLPTYLVPHYFLRLRALPVTRNGKVDISALPLPVLDPGTDVMNKLANSGLSHKLHDLWTSILGVRNISKDDNFFELGGHSLSAARLIVHIHKNFNIRLDLQSVFRHPTLEEMTYLIESSVFSKYTPIEKVGAASLYEVSQSQKRIWIISQYEDEKYIFNIPQSYVLNGLLDRSSFVRAIQKLIARHEILRTVFCQEDGQPMQVVKDEESFGFSVNVIDYTSEKDPDSLLKKIVQDEEVYPFDLEKGPLIRVTLICLNPARHVLLLTIHHIISDGWSLEVMKNDVFASYNSLIAGGDGVLPALQIQYKDFAYWQKKQMDEGSLFENRKYWLQVFAKPAPVIDLPLDFSRPPEKTYNGREIAISMGAEFSQEIIAFAQSADVSLFMFLLTSVYALLHRYTNQSDIVLGTPVAGRVHQDLEDQIGFYVNLLAIRTEVNSKDSFQALLEKVKENCITAYDNEQFPFDQLVEELNLDRDMSRSPLFDILVVLQNTDLEKGRVQELTGITTENFHLDRTVVKYDLSFNFSEVDGEIGLSLEYNSDLFTHSRIERLIGHLQNLVRTAIRQPEIEIGNIDFLTRFEQEQLLRNWNDTKYQYSSKSTILELLERQRLETPDFSALVFKDETYTYEKLHAVADMLAGYLVSHHQVGKGKFVGVILERTALSVVAMLAILKTGACYVPIEVQLPKNRVDYIITDSGISCIVTSRSAGRAEDSGADERFVFVEDIDFSVTNDIAVTANLAGDDLSYIIYTSGSTGNPKGVVQTHRTLFNLINWQISEWETPPGLSFLQTASFGFDASLHDVLYALSTGGRIYLLDEESRADYSLVQKTIVEKEIDVIWFTFSALLALFDELAKDFEHIGLKYIVTTGEAASLDNNLGAYLKKKPEVRLYNFYGPSETHVVTSFKVCGDDSLPVKVPIGKPVFNTEIYILSDLHLLQPLGVIGEIYVRTDNIYKEYLHQPGLTAKNFIPNPFVQGERLYRTGDFGRWNEKGEIEYFGRRDHQVKIRGFRIEMKEIEHYILKYPGIETTLVVYSETSKGEKYLIAYLTKKDSVNITGLRKHLQNYLPEYMMPSYFVQLDEIPLNKNGKVEKTALPAPDTSEESEYVPPFGDTEVRLAEIWENVLGKSGLSSNDNFFKVGGHSLSATRVAYRIAKEFNVDISIRSIYRHATIRELSLEIESQTWVKAPIEADSGDEKLVI